MCLTLEETFAALFSVNSAIASLGGINEWRCIFDERLREFDQEISLEIIFAPSKQTGNRESVWTHLHFSLVLPTLQKIHQSIPPETKNIQIPVTKAEKYFGFLPDVIGHLEEYRDWKILQDATPLGSPLAFSQWCHQYPSNRIAEFLLLFADYIPNDFLVSKLTIDRVLAILPDHWDDLAPQLKDTIQKKDNCCFRRIVQGYYADIKKLGYEVVGICCLAEKYFCPSPNIPKLYYRLRKYWEEELVRCPLMDNESFSQVSLQDIFLLYAKWYQRPGVVEMVRPDFSGAAEESAKQYCLLLEEAKKCISWCPTVAQIEIPSSIRDDHDLLRRFGRLAMFIDTVGNGMKRSQLMDGDAIRNVAQKIWTNEQRTKVWGSNLRYLPQEEKASFFQDIASLLFTTALSLTDYQDKVKVSCRTIEELKNLAGKVKESSSYKEVTALLNSSKELLLAVQDYTIQVDKANSHVFTNFGVRYILQYFGIISSTGMAILPEDLWLGIHVQKLEDQLVITYKEAQREILVDVALEKDSFNGEFSYKNESMCLGGIWYPDYYRVSYRGVDIAIPKIGRGGYDLLGRTGSSHSGLVVGYGCSVFHNSLQLAQIIAACEGASLAELKKIAESFFQIYPEFHHRHFLAEFQTQQIWQAITNHQQVSYLEWLDQMITEKKFDFSLGYEHTKVFWESDGQICKAYCQSVARLVTCYPELYPPKMPETKIDPRESFYDGSCAVIDSQQVNPELCYRGVLGQ